MRHLAISIFVLLYLSSKAQTITGKIVDSDGTPIPYVTLQIGPSYGVITNEEGVFDLNTEGFSDLDTVTLSCLGFASQSYKLSDFTPKTYVLETSISALSEVVIYSKELTIGAILDSVRSNISKNYSLKRHSRVFMRSSSQFDLDDFGFKLVKFTNLNKSKIRKFNKTFDSLKGQFINKTSSYYSDTLFDFSSNDQSAQVAVIKATMLVNKAKNLSTDAINEKMIKNSLTILDTTATYKLKTGLFTIEDSLKVGNLIEETKENTTTGKTKGLVTAIEKMISNNTFGEASQLDFLFIEDDYDYALEGISYFNDNATYIISFKPKRRSGKYLGKLYINALDFALVKLNYEFAENRTGKKLNLKLLLGVKYVENFYRSAVLFKKNDRNTYDLQFISEESGNYVYLNRSLKFIKNRISSKDTKQNLKLKFKVEQNFKSKTELFFINLKAKESNLPLVSDGEYPITLISAYDPAVWKDYNVLSPVKAIIDYKTEE